MGTKYCPILRTKQDQVHPIGFIRLGLSVWVRPGVHGLSISACVGAPGRSRSVDLCLCGCTQAFTVCTMIYMVVGACGYSAFRQRTAGDVLRNLG
jgi:hypothetical protein